MKSRRKSRELALQALYSKEITGETLTKIFCDIREANEEADEGVFTFMERLATTVSEKEKELDDIIVKQCKNWELDRVAILDKNILRLGIAEILYFEDIPPKVSIDEAIELAKTFSTEKSGIFINGILDPIAFREKNSSRSIHEQG
jgi:N utilization substance protein B